MSPLKHYLTLLEAAEAEPGTPVFEMPIQVDFTASAQLPKLIAAGLIVTESALIGVEATLLVQAKKLKINAPTLKPRHDLEVKVYHTQDSRPRILHTLEFHARRGDKLLVALLSAKPYPKLSNGLSVTVILPAGITDEKLQELIRYENEQYVSDPNNPHGYFMRPLYVKFFTDKDADTAAMNVEDMPQYKFMAAHFNDVTKPAIKAKNSYTFEVAETNSDTITITIHGNGYVRTTSHPGGYIPTRKIYGIEGDTEKERLVNAWNFAVKYAKKHWL